MKQRLYIVDDHSIMLEAMVMLIENEPDLEVCGVAGTASEALEALLELDPDLLLADYSMPDMDGIELIKRLQVLKPGLRSAVLSAHTDPVYAQEATEAGANGYILKGTPLEMLEGIRTVLNGETYISPPDDAPARDRVQYTDTEG